MKSRLKTSSLRYALVSLRPVKAKKKLGSTDADFLSQVHSSGDYAGAKRLFVWQKFCESPWGGRVAWTTIIFSTILVLRVFGVDVASIAQLVSGHGPT
jgi:hypothetical protein